MTFLTVFAVSFVNELPRAVIQAYMQVFTGIDYDDADRRIVALFIKVLIDIIHRNLSVISVNRGELMRFFRCAGAQRNNQN